MSPTSPGRSSRRTRMAAVSVTGLIYATCSCQQINRDLRSICGVETAPIHRGGRQAQALHARRRRAARGPVGAVAAGPPPRGGAGHGAVRADEPQRRAHRGGRGGGRPRAAGPRRGRRHPGRGPRAARPGPRARVGGSAAAGGSARRPGPARPLRGGVPGHRGPPPGGHRRRHAPLPRRRRGRRGLHPPAGAPGRARGRADGGGGARGRLSAGLRAGAQGGGSAGAGAPAAGHTALGFGDRAGRGRLLRARGPAAAGLARERRSLPASLPGVHRLRRLRPAALHGRARRPAGRVAAAAARGPPARVAGVAARPPPGARRPGVHRLRPERVVVRRNVAAAVYGQILVTALVATLSEDESISIGSLLVWVALTMLVFWLAHLYAEGVAVRLEREHDLGLADVRELVRNELPELYATLPAVLLPALGWVGVLSRDAAIDIAIGAGVATLAGMGFVIARRSHLPPRATAVSVGVNGAFGLAIVALKVFTH